MSAHLELTFGVEIECFLPEGATQSQAAAAAAHRLGAPVRVESYGHSTPSNWKVVTDGSLGDYSRGCEFVSPILRGQDGLRQVSAICEALTDFGCTVNKKCGLHVHVGVGNAPITFFRNLVKLYATFEPVIDAMMPASRRGSQNLFCRSITSVSHAAIDRCTSLEQILEKISGARFGERRYYKLNLAAYARHRTVEFRQHSGTLDATKASRWTVLCLRMVIAAQGTLSLGTTSVVQNRARPGTKAHRIGQMLMRPEGVTAREICAEVAWPSVSIPQQANICGIQTTSQRMGREVRYFAVMTPTSNTVALTPAGFAATIGAEVEERAYIERRTADLAGPIAWAA